MRKVLLVTLIFLMFFSLSKAQWSIDPFENNAISTLADDQKNPAIVSDGVGGAIITWEDFRNGNYDIYAQRISSLGEILWINNGVKISTADLDQNNPVIISDGEGGAIIAWDDFRNSNNDIYAQRINSHGEVQWKPDGIAISTAIRNQFNPIMVSDELGGAIILWLDNRNDNNYDFYAQRINSSGEIQWKSDGTVIIMGQEQRQSPVIVSDDSSGAIVTWIDYRNDNSDIYAQRINFEGLAQWTADGIAVNTASAGNKQNLNIIGDGSNGAIISWEDNRDGNYNIYAQRINSAGDLQWLTTGLNIISAFNNQISSTIISDGNGGAFLAWDDYRSNSTSNIYVQRINSAGIGQWIYNGITLSTSLYDQHSASIVKDNSGGVIIVWFDFRKNPPDILAQRISKAGKIMWNPNGIEISTAAVYPGSLPIIGFDKGGAIITWDDYRNGGGKHDIYAQKVDHLGFLGVANPTIKKIMDVPNDQGGKIYIYWNASEYDIPPQEVITYYSVWRGINLNSLSSVFSYQQITPYEMKMNFDNSSGVKVYRSLLINNIKTNWEWVGNIPSHYFNEYSFTVPTTSDSTSNVTPYFNFLISAHTENQFIFWDSDIDSGYSVDNLSPLIPQNLIARLLSDGSIELSWSKNNVDPDVKNYQVYRSESEGFTPDETTLISDLNDTGFVDTNVPSNIISIYYKIITVDIHGNMSLPSDEASITLVGVEDDDNIPLEYSISQNYPNPFNPSTIIRYSIKQTSQVILKLYDILGNEIATLVNEEKNPGIYEIEFDAYELTSGVYFYEIQAGPFNYIRKMSLIK